MMNQNPEHTLSILYLDNTLGELYEALDELHSAASDGQLSEMTKLSKRELLAWLRDVIYTAQETIEEIGESDMWHEPVMLRIVDKPGATRRGA